MTEITRYVNPPEQIQRQVFYGPPIVIDASGQVGLKPASGIEVQKTTAIAIGGHRVVYMASDGLRYASNDDVTTRGMALGLSTGSSSASAQASIISTGEVIEPSWSWTVPGLIFLGQNGLLTQTSPGPPALFSQVIGRAIAPTAMFVDIQPPISIG